MATETFTWGCLSDTTGTKSYRVLKVQFGDGYAQTTADGINSVMQSWPLSFADKNPAVISEIIAFLDDKRGYKAFYWTPPLGVQGLYKCVSHQLNAVSGDNYTISATFEEAFKP